MRRIIVVTDADCTALQAVEVASDNVGARCISLTGCRNPKDAHWEPDEVEELILSTPHDPVVILVDDEGFQGEGRGERLLRSLHRSDKLKVMGIVAVASNLKEGVGAPVDISVTMTGEVVKAAVDKKGRRTDDPSNEIYGDTVEVVSQLDVPIIVGLGDPGKMNCHDDAESGAPLTTKALQLVLASADGS